VGGKMKKRPFIEKIKEILEVIMTNSKKTLKKGNEYIKKNWFKLTLVVTLVVFLIFFLYALYLVTLANSKEDLYGNRLLDKSEYIVDYTYVDSRFEGLKDKGVESFKVREQGRIVYALVNLKEDSKVTNFKFIEDAFLAGVKEENLEYYDLQLFISQGETVKIGYKHRTSNIFVWSNN
jgi:hypothetical protein